MLSHFGEKLYPLLLITNVLTHSSNCQQMRCYSVADNIKKKEKKLICGIFVFLKQEARRTGLNSDGFCEILERAVYLGSLWFMI